MIPKDSALDQMQVSDVVSKLKSNVLICAVERGEDIFIPDGSFIMQAGDKISFIASHKDSAAFFKKAGIVNNAVKTAILVGGGKLAYYLAKALSGEKTGMSAQAVGGAVGHNPISIIIPCHRVLGADGSLTGYAAGVEIKQKLLEHEGAR